MNLNQPCPHKAKRFAITGGHDTTHDQHWENSGKPTGPKDGFGQVSQPKGLPPKSGTPTGALTPPVEQRLSDEDYKFKLICGLSPTSRPVAASWPHSKMCHLPVFVFPLFFLEISATVFPLCDVSFNLSFRSKLVQCQDSGLRDDPRGRSPCTKAL